MKELNQYILEKLKINKDSNKYHYHTKGKKELRSLIQELLKERGNDTDLNDIDVSNITDMSELFKDLDIHNIDISEWDVSNVKNIKLMFGNCMNFNSDLNKWDVSNVKNMEAMFVRCINFNSDLSNWDVSNVTNMESMFDGCNSLKIKPSWYK